MENIIKVKIPLGSCKLYAKRKIPWESSKWDLQNKRCAKYALKKDQATLLCYA